MYGTTQLVGSGLSENIEILIQHMVQIDILKIRESIPDPSPEPPFALFISRLSFLQACFSASNRQARRSADNIQERILQHYYSHKAGSRVKFKNLHRA